MAATRRVRQAAQASTVSDYRTQTRRYLISYFGEDTPLSELTPERVEAWQQGLLESGRLARRTIQKAQVMLHAILKRAKKKRMVERNAAEDADRITIKASCDFNVLTPENAEAPVRAAVTDTEAGDLPHRDRMRPAHGRAARAPLA